MELTIRNVSDVTVIGIKGDLTAVTGETLENTYQKISLNGVKKILFAFREDNYINSGGIATLISIAAESKEKGQMLRMSGLSEHFQKVFSIVGITKYITIFPSEEAALENF
jgi:anti-anti-sigma factor